MAPLLDRKISVTLTGIQLALAKTFDVRKFTILQFTIYNSTSKSDRQGYNNILFATPLPTKLFVFVSLTEKLGKLYTIREVDRQRGSNSPCAVQVFECCVHCVFGPGAKDE
jgi:hypothetical protein